jgi:myosin heavy subunit
METQTRQSDKKNYFTAALVIMAALLGLLGYLYFQERQKNQEVLTPQVEAKTRELVATSQRLDSISNQLDAKIAEIKMLNGNVDELMKVKAQLEQDKVNLRNSSAFNAKQYEAKIREYTAVLAQKDREIAQLQRENQTLTSTNQTLAQENTGLKTDLETTRQTYRDSVTTLASQNKELSEKVTIASALKAENISVYAISPKGKERDGGTYKSRRVDKIRVSFRLADNPLTQKENKEIFMRILDPDGAVISDMATGSGSFTFNGSDLVYTAKQAVLYTNTHQTVDFVYSRGQPYKKGKHAIELYSEGFKVGEGEFEVR